MACGCKTEIKNSIYIYRKTWGNRFFGVSSEEIILRYKGILIKTYVSRIKDEPTGLHIENYTYPANEDVFGKNCKQLSFSIHRVTKTRIHNSIQRIIENSQQEAIQNDVNLLYIAFKKGMSEASTRLSFRARCPKCSYYKGGRIKCDKGHEWKDVTCTNFDLKLSIKQYIGLILKVIEKPT